MILRLSISATLFALVAACSEKETPPAADPGPAKVTASPLPAGPLQPELGPPFLERPTEADVLASSPNYGETAVGEAERVIGSLEPELAATALGHMRDGKKVAAVKALREEAASGLLVAKLAAELLAVRHGVNPAILRPEAR